jgi:hypothetical protein
MLSQLSLHIGDRSSHQKHLQRPDKSIHVLMHRQAKSMDFIKSSMEPGRWRVESGVLLRISSWSFFWSCSHLVVSIRSLPMVRTRRNVWHTSFCALVADHSSIQTRSNISANCAKIANMEEAFVSVRSSTLCRWLDSTVVKFEFRYLNIACVLRLSG